MVLFNHATREMTAKIVYYGPGLCGKTTNLLVIFDKLESDKRGKMLSLATKTDRTLFFDLLPVDIGKVGPFNLKIQLYTVPGQVFYNETRKLVLKGADAVVFVVDSQPSMVDSNRESFVNLMENLEQNQIDSNEIPIVIQYNKRDLPGVLPVERLQEDLSFEGFPYMEASALKGDGVMETFKLATKVCAKYLMNKVSGKPLKKRDTSWEPPKPKSGSRSKGVAPEPIPLAMDEPAAADPVLDVNPFAASLPMDSPEEFSSPFPDTPGEYEGVEEVSLEQLLEGRERPATMSGNIAIPVVEEPAEELHEVDEVEEIEELEEVEEVESPIAVVEPEEEVEAFVNTDSGDLASEMNQLRAEVDAMREEQRRIVESLQRVVAELTSLLRG